MNAVIERRSGLIPVSEREEPEWTQDEAIAYECACEAITHLMAIKTKLIHEEEQKENPDMDMTARLRIERYGLHVEREDLQLKDHDSITRIRSEYGAIIRAFMDGRK